MTSPDPAVHPDAPDDVAAALAFASDLVTRLGHEATARQVGVVEDRKEAASLTGAVVTDVDRDLEQAIDDAVRARYPADGLLGEEGADRPSTSGRTWIVDPIDGTLNYARRLGPWSVVLSRWAGAQCELVAVWTGGVLYTATRGGGAHRDGQLLTLPAEPERGGIVRVPARLAGAVSEAGWLVKVVESSAAEVASIADGRVTGTIRTGGHPRDLHAPALLVTEAGGTMTDFTGKAPEPGVRGVVVASPGAHAALLALAQTAR